MRLFYGNLKHPVAKASSWSKVTYYEHDLTQSYGNVFLKHRFESDIKYFVCPLDMLSDLYAYARKNPELSFRVTRIGCGLAGYKDEDIKPFFKNAPTNCILPEGWRQ